MGKANISDEVLNMSLEKQVAVILITATCFGSYILFRFGGLIPRTHSK